RPARLQPAHRYPERRAGHVVQPGVVEEVHRVRVAAVLAADTDLQLRPGRAALLDGDAHQPADALGVQRLERGYAEDAQFQVPGEERALHVVAGEAPTQLGQI